MGTYFCQQPQERQHSRSGQDLKLAYKVTNLAVMKPLNMKSKQYFPCKYLGKGIYGTTIEVFHRLKKQQRFAQKILKTDLLVQNYVFLDRQKFELLNSSQFFMRVKEIIIQKEKMYILYERYYLGDLYYYSKKYPKKIDQSFIKRLTIRIVIILEKLHLQHKVIYRNLRPENILFINNQGNFILTQLMFCYDGEVAESYYGAATYTPPEVYRLGQNGYDYMVDYWMLGVLLYEILIGKTPFQYGTVNQIKDSIVGFQQDNLKFPQQLQIPQYITDFITKLLNPNPRQRMSLQEIKRHQMFHGQIWDIDQELQFYGEVKSNLQRQDIYVPNRIVYFNYQKARPLIQKIQPYMYFRQT